MVDVCLVVEGTYPYVKGGVSSWVHQLITNLPDMTFAIVHITTRADATKELKYTIPPNVKLLQEIYLFDYNYPHKPKFNRLKKGWKDDYLRFHNEMKSNNYQLFQHLITSFHHHAPQLSFEEMTFSTTSWDIVKHFYDRSDPQQSFVDYFWTWRHTHMSLFKIMNHDFPRAYVIHTVSTGYAGFASVVMKMKQKIPLLLTEHGIYTRERKIEIENTQWIYQEKAVLDIQSRKDFFKKMWIDFFCFTGKITYQFADQIITLCSSNKEIEVSEGADKDKITIIPNGIYPQQYLKQQQAFDQREKKPPFTIGFVGRVVSIKDIKTLIRALKIVYDTIKDISVLIIGPTDEELDYYEECMELIEMFGLQPVIEFTGSVNVNLYYPRLDILVLTSISEGQPLVILEANCVGVPVVATDVGSCKELLYGFTPEDQRIGPSGIVTEVANPHDTAAGIVTLLENPALRLEYGLNGRKRVSTYYRQDDLLAHYNTLYGNLKYSAKN